MALYKLSDIQVVSFRHHGHLITSIQYQCACALFKVYALLAFIVFLLNGPSFIDLKKCMVSIIVIGQSLHLEVCKLTSVSFVHFNLTTYDLLLPGHPRIA